MSEERTQQPSEPEAPDPAWEASVEAALDEILGQDESDEEAPEAPEGPSGDAAVAPKRAAGAPDDPEEGEPEDDGGVASDGGSAGGEYETALRGLALLNTPKEVLDSLTPEQAVAWWEKRKAAEAKTKRTIEELRAKAEGRQTDGGEHQGVPTSPEEPGPSESSQSGQELQGIPQEMREKLEFELGPEAVEALDAIIRPLQQEVVALRQQRAAAEAERARGLVEQTRAKLAGDFPEIGENWQEVAESMQVLSQRAKYEQILSERGEEAALEALMRDAARAAGLAEVSEQDRKRQQRARSARRNGRPATTDAPLPGPDYDSDEEFNFVIDKVFRGWSADQIRRAKGG